MYVQSFSSVFNAMLSLPSFSCSAVAFVTNFIGVKKTETPQLFGLPQSRDVILIAVRPDCAVSAPLPLLFVSLPLLSACHYLPSFCSRCRRCRIVDGASNQISAHFHFRSSFTLIPSWGLPLPPLLRNYKFSCYIITVSLALPRSIAQTNRRHVGAYSPAFQLTRRREAREKERDKDKDKEKAQRIRGRCRASFIVFLLLLRVFVSDLCDYSKSQNSTLEWLSET